MVETHQLHLMTGYGILNDSNACPISPRQILITRKEDLDALDIRYGGLRENIILTGCPETLFRPGSLMVIGEVKIRLTFYCEPCKRIADEVPSMNAVLKRRGILGVIVHGGDIHVSAEVVVESGVYDPFSEIPYERFLLFARQLPKGKVITYKTVCKGMGVAESYIRAIPQYIAKAIETDPAIPVHRIVNSTGNLIAEYIPQQQEMLEAEGITILEETSSLSDQIVNRVDLELYGGFYDDYQ